MLFSKYNGTAFNWQDSNISITLFDLEVFQVNLVVMYYVKIINKSQKDKSEQHFWLEVEKRHEHIWLMPAYYDFVLYELSTILSECTFVYSTLLFF